MAQAHWLRFLISTLSLLMNLLGVNAIRRHQMARQIVRERSVQANVHLDADILDELALIPRLEDGKVAYRPGDDVVAEGEDGQLYPAKIARSLPTYFLAWADG